MTYYFGSSSRLRPYGDISKAIKLNIFNIFKLRENDIILVSRAWSPLIAIIFSKKRRPRIIQFADGLVTESNCTKYVNSYPHKIYKEIYADVLYVRQPLDSLPGHINPTLVKSTIDFDIASKIISFDSVVIVFGNDPYVGFTQKNLVKELVNLKKKINNNISIDFSSTNRNVKIIMKKIFPNSNNIGHFSNYSKNFIDTLIISTPSTIALDSILSGYNVVALSGCDCQTMSKLFKSSKAIKVAANSSHSAEIYSCQRIQRWTFSMPEKRPQKTIKFKLSFIGLKRLFGDFICVLKPK